MERRKNSTSHGAANIKKKTLALDSVRTANSCVGISVNDLVAFEYVDDVHCWQWGLATVAALPGPRLVQLLLWRHDGMFRSNAFPPATVDISKEERNRAIERLEKLRQQRALVSAEVEAMNQRLTTEHSAYTAGRRRIKEGVQAAERTLLEVHTRVMEIQARDWREIRCYHNPPDIIVLVMEAVLMVLGERCLSWQQIQGIIRGRDFLQRVKEFDPLKLSNATKCEIERKFLTNPKFTYADAINGSGALGYLQQWVVAQVEAATVMGSLAEYDIMHSKERVTLSDMEQQIDVFQKALQEYANEEDRLRSLLEGQPLIIDNCGIPGGGGGGGSVVDGERSEVRVARGKAAPKEGMREADANIIVPRSGTAPKRAKKGNDNAVKNNSGGLRECVHGTDAIWSLTEELVITLRSAILCNYDRPESTIIRLTPEQVREIEDALKNRGSHWDQEWRVEDVRRRLQAELEELRGRHGHVLKRVQGLENENHVLQKELRERQDELDRLNQAITENGLLQHTPRCSHAASSLRSTPRVCISAAPHHTTPVSPLLISPAVPAGGSAAVHLNDVEEDAAKKIMDLEKRLTRALHENPTEAQVQLLEDDLRALQEELRRSKEELENFRSANVPYCYTSSALRIEQLSTPEGQLAAAHRQIEELEAALGEALDQKQQQQRVFEEGGEGGDELRAQLRGMQDELLYFRQNLEAAAERLNEELHAHEATRRNLAQKEQEIQALWQLQNVSEMEKELAIDALNTNESELQDMRERLQNCLDASNLSSKEPQHSCTCAEKSRTWHLREVTGRIAQEAQRQKQEWKSTELVLNEVRALLGVSVPG